jgi:hypothetical protein
MAEIFLNDTARAFQTNVNSYGFENRKTMSVGKDLVGGKPGRRCGSMAEFASETK